MPFTNDADKAEEGYRRKTKERIERTYYIIQLIVSFLVITFCLMSLFYFISSILQMK